ncbi:MAG: glycosyltransferase [bacterium]
MGYRILHINTAKTWRGGEQQTLYLAQGLQGLGHKNFVACQPDGMLLKRLAQTDVVTIPVLMRGEWDMISVIKLARIIRNHQIDILHIHTAHAHTLGALAAKINPTCKVIVSRRVDFHIHSKAKYRRGLDRIIAVSRGVRDVLVEDGIAAENIAVVHDGIDLERFKKIKDNKYLREEFNLKDDMPVVGIVAALAPHKHHENFLEAAAIVKKEMPNARFLIVGEGELEARLKKLARALELEKEVIFCGFREDILELISTFDVFVLSSYLEGMGSTLLEAMALSKPVVATQTGGIPEVVKDGQSGILVPSRDSEKLAAGIVDLLKNKDKRINMGKAGRKIAEGFGVGRMVSQTEEIYKEVNSYVKA